jgi:hypothetical protein
VPVGLDDNGHEIGQDLELDSTQNENQLKQTNFGEKVIESEVNKISNEYVSGMLEKIGSEQSQRDKNTDSEPKDQNKALSQITNESL